MNLLVIDQTDNWQKSLWLEILNSPQVTGLQYIDLVGQSVNSTMEYMVQGTAYEGGGFLTEMPFSWLINRHINEYLKNTSEEPLPDGQGILVLLTNELFYSFCNRRFSFIANCFYKNQVFHLMVYFFYHTVSFVVLLIEKYTWHNVLFCLFWCVWYGLSITLMVLDMISFIVHYGDWFVLDTYYSEHMIIF